MQATGNKRTFQELYDSDDEIFYYDGVTGELINYEVLPIQQRKVTKHDLESRNKNLKKQLKRAAERVSQVNETNKRLSKEAKKMNTLLWKDMGEFFTLESELKQKQHVIDLTTEDNARLSERIDDLQEELEREKANSQKMRELLRITRELF